MANRRTYTDEELIAAVAASTNWTQVQRALGKKPGSAGKEVKAAADRPGLDTSHFAHKQSFRPVPAVGLPFSNAARHGSWSGLSVAARWFLDRGYVVSVPLEPAIYDLVTESDEDLKRVQVKTTRQISPGGRHVVDIARKVYAPGLPYGANGPRKRVPYEPGSVDYFFIVTPGLSYLIPVEVVAGLCYLNLDGKYAAFAVTGA